MGAGHAAQKALWSTGWVIFGLLLGISALFWATGSVGFEDIGLRLSPRPWADGSVLFHPAAV